MSECIRAAQKHQLLVHRPVPGPNSCWETHLKAKVLWPRKKQILANQQDSGVWQGTTAVTSVGILREHQEVVLGAEAEQVWRVPSGPNGKMSIDRYWLPEWLQQTSEECSYDPVCLPGVGVYTDVTWNSSLHDPSSKGVCVGKTHFHQSEKYSDWMVFSVLFHQDTALWLMNIHFIITNHEALAPSHSVLWLGDHHRSLTITPAPSPLFDLSTSSVVMKRQCPHTS